LYPVGDELRSDQKKDIKHTKRIPVASRMGTQPM